MHKLMEGLRPNDLKGMLDNYVSVDEYESKIDEAALVIAFYVSDRHAAQDVSRFIQKSFVDLLDSEVSSSPDQNGNYLVFVELPTNSKVGKEIAELCDDLSSLGDIKTWRVKVRGEEVTEGIPAKEIQKVIDQGLSDSLHEYFSNTSATNILVEGCCKVRFDTFEMQFSVTDHGLLEDVARRKDLLTRAVDLSIVSQRMCRNINNLLGSNWSVEKLGEQFLLVNKHTNQALLIET